MALRLFWRCEGTTLDGTHDYTAGDTTVDTSGSPTISATGAKVGSNGISGAGYYYFDNVTPTAIIGTEQGVIAGWAYVSSWVSLSAPIYLRGSSYQNAVKLAFTDASGSGNLAMYINEDTGASTLATTGANLTTGAWYFLIGAWDNSGSGPRRYVGVYNSSGTLIAENSSTDAFTSPPNLQTLRFGSIDGFSGYVDNIFGSDDYDDVSTILSNRDITSYTSYGGGGAAPTITDAGDESYFNGETGIVVTGTNFGATEGTVKICPTDDVDDANGVIQTVTAWGDTSATFTCVRGSLALNTNLYLFVITDGDQSNASGHVVQIAGTRKLKLLIEAAAVGATVDGIVWAKAAGQIAGAEIGEFTGATIAAGTGADSGYAVLKVPVADFGGGALNVNDTVLCYVKNATNFAAPWDATIIEE